MSRTPWVTGALALAAVVVTAVPGAVDAVAMTIDVESISWRWWASSLGHCSPTHLLWDVGALVVLGVWLERADRLRLAALYAIVAPLVAVGAVALTPGIWSYQGLSGVDSALVGAVTVALFRSARSPGERRAAVALAGGFFAKTVYELGSGTLLFAGPEGWTPTPIVHVIGAVVGALIWAAPGWNRRTATSAGTRDATVTA